MATILIIGSSMLIGYVSSKIFIKYVNDKDKEFIENLDIEMVERGIGNKSRDDVKYLLENERDKGLYYIYNQR